MKGKILPLPSYQQRHNQRRRQAHSTREEDAAIARHPAALRYEQLISRLQLGVLQHRPWTKARHNDLAVPNQLDALLVAGWRNPAGQRDQLPDRDRRVPAM